ncbi:hydroxymethylbilane synthase [Salinarimonas soli]|uniref:Porphobilinogen deaminase n=1 Tax=Salinarimonas soli TaxID=1638099 RepID=A0A5B2VIA7_9HYPH|nr:hydroxymethylbilane synthase [Salinarimonas soli]KAA2237917.1 hydroxymethylbilane synthase [Salinarimonas soli]
MTDRSTLVIGTRGSPLALAQAHETQRRLMQALGVEADALPIRIIKVMGDAIQDRPLSEAGGKGLFTKEIDVAQLEGAVDIAVHSAKDLPNDLPDGLCIAGYLPREDVRDAFISPLCGRIQDLPHGARVGSASLRRQAMIRRLRPDLDVALMRGNVNTRLAKIERGEYGATLLALAGLKRLGFEHHVTAILDTEEFLPAVGQGAIAVTARTGDERARAAVARIADEATGVALAAERAFLRVLDGSCRTPIAGHARLSGSEVAFRGMVLRPDGSQSVETTATGGAAEAGRLGTEAGHEVRGRIPPGFFLA